MTALILFLFLLFAGPVPAADDAPPPWVVLVYNCNRPVGIILNTDPPRFFPASGNLTPYVVSIIDKSINAKRSAVLDFGYGCVEKQKI